MLKSKISALLILIFPNLIHPSFRNSLERTAWPDTLGPFLELSMNRLCLALAFVAVVGILNAQTPAPRTAGLSWSAITKDIEGNAITGVTYKVYQGIRGASKTAVRTGLTANTLSLTSLSPGETCWQISANSAGGESALSNEACKSFPVPGPAAPTLVVD